MHQPNQDCFFVGWELIELLSQFHLQAATKNILQAMSKIFFLWFLMEFSCYLPGLSAYPAADD
jgi:hypothetical protein